MSSFGLVLILSRKPRRMFCWKN